MSTAVAILVTVLLMFFFWLVNTRPIERSWATLFNIVLVVCLVMFLMQIIPHV